MPVWYDDTNISHRLGHPFVHPGGPCVVSEPAAARRQTVGQFHQQATAAWNQLVDTVQQGLQEQLVDTVQQGLQEQALNDTNAHFEGLEDPQQQWFQQQQQRLFQQQQQQQGLDLSGLAVPLLARKRMTGPVLLVPQPDPPPPGLTPKQAADAARAAALAAAAAAAAEGGTFGPGRVLEALVVPKGCLLLHSWQESAAAVEPPGEVALRNDGPPAAAAAAAAAAAGVGGFDDDVVQAGSEVVVTLSVMDTSRRLTVVQQEIQALGSNTLADIRDVISCPTDLLAAGLGSHNPAAYFYIDKTFYDDTRVAPAAECSAVVEQWGNRLGIAGPRILLQHFEPPEDAKKDVLQQLQQLLADTNGTQQQAQQQQQQQQQHFEPPVDSEAHVLQQLLADTNGTQLQQQQQQYAAAGELGDEQQQQQQQQQQLKPAADSYQLQQDHQQQEQQEQQQQQQQQQQRDMHLGALRDLALQDQQQQQQQPRRDMQSVQLRDLVLQASNRPMALYSHQGLCEHAVVITDVRLLHASDPNRRSAYPRTVFQASLGKRLHCGVCKKRGASALMLDHPETPEAVVVLCVLCCGLFDVQQDSQAKLIMLDPL